MTMPLINRLDHAILCCRNRQEWIPVIERVLGLRPRRTLEGDAWGFSNAEFDIGDGFLGLVEPSGQDSQLHRFLDRFPEGFYAMSVAVGPLADAAAFLDAREVRYRRAMRDGQTGLLWMPPAATDGVLYQLTVGGTPHQGSNPLYRGISGMVVAVADLDHAVDSYQQCFGFDGREAFPVASERFGYRGIELTIPGAALGDTIVLAAPDGSGGAVAAQLADRGPGIFQFTIDVSDLSAELQRLADLGVATDSSGGRAWIDPPALKGVRVELSQPA